MTDLATLENDCASLHTLKADAEALGASEGVVLTLEGAIILMETGLETAKSLKAMTVALRTNRGIMAQSAIVAAERDIAQITALAVHCGSALAGMNDVPIDERLGYVREALRIMLELSATITEKEMAL